MNANEAIVVSNGDMRLLCWSASIDFCVRNIAVSEKGEDCSVHF